MSWDAEAEICVIGGGVMGGFAALSLAEAGAEVILVERLHPGAGASGVNPGTVALQNKRADAIPLVLESLRKWETLSERLGMDVQYQRRGGFRLAETDSEVEQLELDVAIQKAAGVRTEIVQGVELEREASYLGPSVKAASYCPDDGLADPLRTVGGLRLRLGQLGATLWSGCAVHRIDAIADNDIHVVTEKGTVRARWVLCAAGAWTAQLIAQLGITLPLSKEVMISSITDQSPLIFPHILTHVRGHLTLKQQTTTGKVLIGGGWGGEEDEASGRHRVLEDSLKANLRLAVSIVPRLKMLNLIRAWSGVEGRSPDRRLVIGPLQEPLGVFVLCCAAGGFTISPFAGELAARWILNGHPDWPVDPYHVQRFQTTDNLGLPDDDS